MRLCAFAPNPLFTTPTNQEQYRCPQCDATEAMEEWGNADARVIQRSFTAEVCISCASFTYRMDANCRTCVGCALMQAQLEQGQHLTFGCRNWKPVHHIATGPAVAA